MNVIDYFFSESKYLKKDFVLGPKERISYDRIYDNVFIISRYLNKHVGENQNIILISENSVFFLAAYLGIMKSGNICIPLNPYTEEESFRYIVEATKCQFAFIQGKIHSKYSHLFTHTITESDLETVTSTNAHSPGSLTNAFDENRVAQILFTSGSTGLPKGVMLSHKNLISNTNSIIQYLRLNSNDVIEIVLPFYYCYGLSLLHTHIKVGGSVVLNNGFVFLGSVFDDLKKYRCTGFAGVPSHFQILLRKSQTFTKTDFPHLKYVTQAGGKLHKTFIKEFVKAFPDKKFYVMYGQTEATARLSYLPPSLIIKKLGSIGKAIPGVTLEVVNKSGQPVNDEQVGEIVAKGDNIMIGYLNDPEANKTTLKNGWLHTGDMAKKDKDGFIYIVARKKEIIKVGGRRVSPKEIEEVIVSVPEVVDCTVEGVEDEILGETVKAIVVLKQSISQEVGREKILTVCSKKLALYKIPQIIHFEDNVQIALTGKKIKKQN